LAHTDSLGNKETISRGAVQFTSAGSGVHHSEFNGSKQKLVHFLQIWVTPATTGLSPNYQTVEWEEKDKTNKLALIVAPAGMDAKEHGKHVVINQDIKMFASVLQPSQTVSYTLPRKYHPSIHQVDA
jgi:redox-sensitive bicupin YhaK (pirin superfamily)